MNKNWCFMALCMIFTVVLYAQSDPDPGLASKSPITPATEKDFSELVKLVHQDLVTHDEILALVKKYKTGSIENVKNQDQLVSYILARWDRLYLRAQAEAPNTELAKMVLKYREEFTHDVREGVKVNGSIYATPVFKTVKNMAGIYHALGYKFSEDQYLIEPIMERFQAIVLQEKLLKNPSE